MNLKDVREFLREHIQQEAQGQYGLADPAWIDRVTDNWFSDEVNYDGRWAVIGERTAGERRILDMAAGCGTFMLYGLRNGYDVWGVEPERWKREYYRRKVQASGYPNEFLYRLVDGVGEALPFDDETFDLVTTYQTLEHVQDVNKCIEEMLRVLKCGGILYIRAPDYNSFFEPHYRVPFLPRMNKKLASSYLKVLKRPTLGLQGLQWVTEKQVLKCLMMSRHKLHFERTNAYYKARRLAAIKERLPRVLANSLTMSFCRSLYEARTAFLYLTRIGREEKNIDLWVTKIE